MGLIEQRRIGQRRRVECTTEGVKFLWHTPFIRQEYTIRYEEVLQEPVEFTQQTSTQPVMESMLLAVGLLLAFFAIANPERDVRLAGSLMAALAWLAAGVVWLVRRWPRLQLLQMSSGDPALVLFADRPDRESVAKFAEALRARSHEYLRSTYGSAPPHESKVGRIERLHQLKEAGALSEAEYDALKAEVIAPRADAPVSGQYI